MIDPYPYPPGYEDYRLIFGRATGLPVEERIIWDASRNGSGYNGLLSSESNLTIVSSSDDDKVGGGGATEVTFTYQGEDGIERFHTIELNGLTPVDVPIDILADVSYFAYVSEGEDNSLGGSNHGNIECYKTGSTSTILWQINTGEGQTLMCLYRVPLGKFFEVDQVYAFPQDSLPCVVRFRSRVGKDYPWRSHAISNALDAPVPVKTSYPIVARPGTTFCMTCEPVDSGTDISCLVAGRMRNYIV